MPINNAGAGPSQETLGEINQEVLLHTYTVNAAGPLLMAQQFLPLVKAGSDKKIVNLSSGVGSITNCAASRNYAYYAGKAALNMLTKQLILAVADAGITCSVIDALTPAQNGAYLDYQGNRVPWYGCPSGFRNMGQTSVTGVR